MAKRVVMTILFVLVPAVLGVTQTQTDAGESRQETEKQASAEQIAPLEELFKKVETVLEMPLEDITTTVIPIARENQTSSAFKEMMREEFITDHNFYLKQQANGITAYLREAAKDDTITRKNMLVLRKKIGIFDKAQKEADEKIKYYGERTKPIVNPTIREAVSIYFKPSCQDKKVEVSFLLGKAINQPLKVN